MRISGWSSDVCSSDLNILNEERRAIEAAVQDAAEAMTSAQHNRAIAVLAGKGWHPGVIGIVAGRLKESLAFLPSLSLWMKTAWAMDEASSGARRVGKEWVSTWRSRR